MKNRNEKTTNKNYFIMLAIALFLSLALIFILLGINRNWKTISLGFKNFVNSVVPNTFVDETTIEVPDELDGEFTLVSLEPCDLNTIAKPKSMANISIDGKHEYYSYTDEHGRIIRSDAKELHSKKKENDRTGRYCNGQFPHSKNQKARQSIGLVINSADERGHLIADRFNGVSNAYNITAQHGNVNRVVFGKIENQLDDAINNNKKVTDFIIEVKYKTITDRRPEYYDVYYKIDNKAYQYRMYNDKRPIEELK